MKVRLFAQEPPQGRCLILAQKLSQATSLQPAECVALAERLFAFAYNQGNPALVEVPESRAATDLLATCAEFGISADFVQHDGGSTET